MNTRQKLATLGVTASLSAMSAFAVPAIENDTLEGLPSVGTDLGGFLSNLAPGVGVFLLILGLFGGITAIVFGISKVVGQRMRQK